MDEIQKIIDLLEESIKDDATNSITSWNIIKKWFDKQIDETRHIIENSQKWLAEYQKELIEKTWIPKLKIKYTWIMWYFIEVPLSSKDDVLEDFVHKQTLVNAVRYITSELKNFEQKTIQWEATLVNREYEIFQRVRKKILDQTKEIKKVSKYTSNIDMFSALARVAYRNSYVKPEIWKDFVLDIKWWRHPIIENVEWDFISNDLNLNDKDFIHIITWPNMWWKSTFLRQNALIIILSHIWSFVPATSAKIPLIDKVFSRVWASDNLFMGQSTFMVEMQETAWILHSLTDKSFVIIDEIWRWTSTYDWMSLAYAILDHLHKESKAKVLFATHYHELIEESQNMPWVDNYSVWVWEKDWEILFLRKIQKWWITKSYWIEVAKLSWIPIKVINKAKKMLDRLENSRNYDFSKPSLWFENNSEIILLEEKIENLEEILEKKDIEINKIKNIDLDNLTPMQAMLKLQEIKNLLEK